MIRTGNIRVCVVGVGRIGLPTAISCANSRFSTVGYDINAKLVHMINSGEYPLKDEPGFDEMFYKVVRDKKLHATIDGKEAVSNSDIVILSLPTPMDKNNVPDYSALISVGRQLNQWLEPSAVVIVESTVEPGFIENELITVIEGDGQRLSAGKNLGVAACPETANPGQILRDFEVVPRLVGAMDEKTAKIVEEIYRHVFKAEILSLPDCKTANAAKLTANVFRDVNIAFVNELAILFEKLGIDIMTVLKACDQKYNFETHYPGAGVGGPCLPVNSYQLLNSGKLLNGKLKIVRAAREINEHMPHHVVELLVDALNEAKKAVKESTVAILGVSYKPDVKDIQLSPAEDIIKEILGLGAKIRIYDPFFKAADVFSQKTENSLFDAITGADATIIVTAHKEFRDVSPSLLKEKMKTPVLIDARGIIDTTSARKSGLILRGIGRQFIRK
ncbi:MAG: nucleotide sugar dehydrogenase [Thaumarchaeota archaeon]|nr:nucleotide sugar dehydrogenase [Nitrososphaerota archaeon]